MPATPVSVSEATARALLNAGVEQFFGLMGNGNAFFVDAVERLAGGVVPVRHEVATVASADAYYRVTRRPAVATVTYGAGFTNTLTALAEAAQARIPLVLVAGDAPTTGPRPWDIDQAASAAALDVQTVTLGPDDAAPATREALAEAVEQRRPIVLAIPYDLANTPCTEAGREGLDGTDALPAGGATSLRAPGADALELPREEAEWIADALAQASRPLILAGRGARGAEADLRALAAELRADVATTAPAQGTFHTESPAGWRNLGVCGGFAAPGSSEALREADVVLVVGAGLNQFTMSFGQSFGEHARVLQIDLAEQPTHARVDELFTADAAQAAAAVRSAFEGLVGEVCDGRAEAETGADGVVDPAARDEGRELAEDGRLDPRSLMTRIDRALPRERVVMTDGGHFLEWPVTYLTVDGPDQMLTVGTQYQSIGLGFPSAPGVIAAAGDRITVLVSGDGGGLMGIADAETFVRTARRGVIIMMNDAAYGAEVHQYGSRGLAEAPMLIPEVDFAGIFAALGTQASTVRTLEDLEDFEQWAAAGAEGVYALDCRISNQVMALHMHEVLAQATK